MRLVTLGGTQDTRGKKRRRYISRGGPVGGLKRLADAESPRQGPNMQTEWADKASSAVTEALAVILGSSLAGEAEEELERPE
jgi:hypothetical protein